LWAEQASTVAAILARIHMLPCPVDLQTILPNATTQMTWFLRNGIIPDYMKAYPEGPSIWEIINQALPQLQSFIPTIVHGDFWSGNILWDRGQVTGVLDWENAACGESGFDVANCRMEMIVDGMDAAADTFLKTYESITNRTVANLGLCELVVAVQPMWQRAPFLEISQYRERFRQFVANAMDRM
jgi:aminoglycoside phosphotransferase (APT) family kinase protein